MQKSEPLSSFWLFSHLFIVTFSLSFTEFISSNAQLKVSAFQLVQRPLAVKKIIIEIWNIFNSTINMTNKLFLKANRHITKLYKKWKDVDKVFCLINSNSREVSRHCVRACMWNYTRNMPKYRLKRRMEKIGHNMAWSSPHKKITCILHM